VINKEEIRENIRELMFDFTNSDSTVEIDMKSPTEVDVELNGKFFNTYLVKEKKFKHNIVHEAEQKSEFKMDIVIISPDISEEYKQYRGAPLQLPATEFEIKDALCRARVTDNGQVCRISECILYDKDIVGEFLARNKEVDLEELNYLAKVMSRFDKHEHELFKGYMAMKGPFVLSVKDLINAAYNLHCCDLTYDIDEDEMLGRYYADNGLLEWLGDARKEVWEFLDYTKLGRTIREKENGVYTESGYFVFNPNEYSTVYDGGEFPEKFINDGYIFKLLIAKSETGRAADGKWLSLPASKERKASFARELGAESLDECILLAVQSIECNMPTGTHTKLTSTTSSIINGSWMDYISNAYGECALMIQCNSKMTTFFQNGSYSCFDLAGYIDSLYYETTKCFKGCINNISKYTYIIGAQTLYCFDISLTSATLLWSVTLETITSSSTSTAETVKIFADIDDTNIYVSEGGITYSISSVDGSKYKIILLTIIVILVLGFGIIYVDANDANKILSVDINGLGYAEVIGYVPEKGCEVTFLMLSGDGSDIQTEDIIYIDQITSGNNGTYLFQFKIPERFSNMEYTLIINSNSKQGVLKKASGTLPVIPAKIYGISNNALIVGNDAYDIGCAMCTPDNIANSLVTGGNKVYFKYGDNWYDLLDVDATTNAYLTEANAIPEDVYSYWVIDNYYTITGDSLSNLEL